jgi:acyl carrier protein
MMQLTELVDEVLTKLATIKKVNAGASPAEIVTDSLDQMRLLVMLEERLDTSFDDDGLRPFDLSSRQALVASVRTMLGPQAA